MFCTSRCLMLLGTHIIRDDSSGTQVLEVGVPAWNWCHMSSAYIFLVMSGYVSHTSPLYWVPSVILFLYHQSVGWKHHGKLRPAPQGYEPGPGRDVDRLREEADTCDTWPPWWLTQPGCDVLRVHHNLLEWATRARPASLQATPHRLID
jgi:hypothetical protein